MNKTEFKEMQNEFAGYVYRYEFFLKCGAIDDCYYNHYFGKELLKLRYYNLENTLIAECIKLKSEGKTSEEITKFIDGFRNKFFQENKIIEQKNELADKVYQNTEKLSLEDRRKFEDVYLKYVTIGHPIVKCLPSQEEEKIFPVLNKLYKENDFEEFNKIYNANIELFKDVEINEEDYSKISTYYYETKKGINADYSNKQNVYPYNKSETLKNEISIARELGEIKVRLNNLISVNKQLHKDYFLAFDADITLE